MFELSSKTQVNRKFRLTELYKMIEADKAVKADAKIIESIVLTNALSQETLNLTSEGNVKELYIFDIELASKAIPSLFLASLDKAIELHTMYVLRCGGEKMLYGAFKEYTEKGVKIGKYYGTAWTKEDKKMPLPYFVRKVDDIYDAIIRALIPIEAIGKEQSSDLVARYEKITKLKKEIEKKQKQVDNERQSKRRFELNAELKTLKEELTKLEK